MSFPAVSSVIGALLGLYVAYAAAMVALHTRFIYPFLDTPFEDEGYETVRINAGAQALVSRGAPGSAIVVYFMGNAGAPEFYRAMLDHHTQQGRSVVVMAYRGGGGFPGHPSEKALKEDALDLIDLMPDIVPEGPVIVQGYSLGTGLALHVAALRDVDGVILSAPYDKLCRLMAKASYLPACLLPVQSWKSARDAVNVTHPVLVLHGSEDQLIPIAEGMRLAERLPNYHFERVEGAAHADMLNFPPYLDAIDTFIAARSP